MKDLHHNISTTVMLEAQDLTYTDTNTALLDVSGFESVEILVCVGALTGVDSSNYVLATLQEANVTTGTSFAAVDSSEILGAFTTIDAAAEDSVIQRVGYIGDAKYLRVNLNYTGTGISAGIVGVYGILGNPRHAPVSTDTAAVAST